VTLNFGSSGSFFAQLANQAPFDLFLSADIEYAHRLAEAGQGANGGAFPYARGHIVVWTRNDADFDLEREDLNILREGRVQKIAIANPKTAPYGRAAVAALHKLGIYEAVESKLVYAESVAQAAQMVQTGSADIGIIALSLAISPALRDTGKSWRIPDDAYPPIIQGGIVLSWARDAGLADAFREFLLGGGGASILTRFGFGPPGD
jgi:molybdate transport system substrate-binding protein